MIIQPKFCKVLYTFMLNCCPTKYKNNGFTNCRDYGTQDGRTCGHDQSIYQACGSNNRAACKVGSGFISYTNTLQCCDNDDIETEDSPKCSWQYGGNGDNLVCPDKHVLAGLCGSDSSDKCDHRNYTNGIYCCPYEDKPPAF